MSDTTNLVPCNMFATPDSVENLQEYLSRFNGSEAMVAQTCAMMAWNLACKLTSKSESETPQGADQPTD